MAFWQSPVGWTLITIGQIFAVLLPSEPSMKPLTPPMRTQSSPACARA